MQEFTRTVPAPAELGVAVMAVREGTDLDLDIRLESVMEGVFVSGMVRGEATGECTRCLNELDVVLNVHLGELFIYPERAKAAEDSGDDEEADEVHELVDDLLDLEPVVRDTIVMALPFQPLCSRDCLGLCSECGVRLSDPGNEDHSHEILDPRWAALGNMAGAGLDVAADAEGESPSTDDDGAR